ncbi:MAG: IPT/TIG domain-containing protein [Acidobacteriota bacterium]
MRKEATGWHAMLGTGSAKGLSTFVGQALQGIATLAAMLALSSTAVAQVPQIITVAPSYTVVNQPIQITLLGQNFTATSSVRWNGEALPNFTYVSATEVRADVPLAKTLSVGSAQITVFDPGGGLSNDKRFYVYSSPPGPPGLTSISPNMNIVGGAPFTLVVTGNNFVDGSVVRWNLSERNTTFVGSTELRADILASDISTAMPVSVSVLNPDPGGISESLPFTIHTVSPVPTLTSLNPTAVTRFGSAFVLEVRGTNFVSNSQVYWNGNARGTTFVNNGELRADIPDTDLTVTGTAEVKVTTPNPGGGLPGGGTSNSLSVTINESSLVPVLTSLSPTAAVAGGASFQMTVRGANFVPGTTVRWNGQDRVTTFVSATELRVNVLNTDIGAVGTASVTVYTPPPGGGTSGTLTFTINNPLPSITGLSPVSTLRGSLALVLVINGAYFVNGSVAQWNGTDLVTTFVNSSQLRATVPSANLTTAGVAFVRVVNLPTGGGTSNEEPFFITNPLPTVTSLAPATVVATGDAFTLTVNGTNFVPTSKVRWNGQERTTTFVTSTRLTAAISAEDISQPGNVTVTVYNPEPGGGESKSVTLPRNSPIPILTSVNPTSTGIGTPGLTITVTGSKFVSTSKVYWNGSARVTTFVSSTELKGALTSADLAKGGVFSVTVVNSAPGGGTSASVNFSVAFGQPVITSISPDSAAANTKTLTLTVNGSGFVSGSRIRWDDLELATRYVSATQLTAALSSTQLDRAGTVNVTVSNPDPGGGISNSQAFTVLVSNPLPTLTSLSPAGQRAGSDGFTLSVFGTGFVAESKVLWNGSERETTFISGSNLTAAITSTDLGQKGTVSVSVFNPSPGGGTSATKAFTVTDPLPILESLNPSSMLVGSPDFTLVVTGRNFISASKVRWNGLDRTTKYVSSAQLTVAVKAADVARTGTNTVEVVNVAADGPSEALPFVVETLQLSGFRAAPSSIRGGGTVTGSLTLNGPAPPGGVSVTLSSSHPTTAVVPANVVIPAGNNGMSFGIHTQNVSESETVTISASFGGVTQRQRIVVADSRISDGGPESTEFVPIILSSSGANNSFYTSSLTLTNRGSATAILDFSYIAALGEGSGTASDLLLPGHQRVATNAINYLRALGIPIPDSGNRGGTLRVRFWGLKSAEDVKSTVRTTTAVPEGRAGLSYAGVTTNRGLTGPAYLFGLRQSEQDRSNLAIQNLGSEQQGDVILSITVYSGNPGDYFSLTLPDEVLSPGAFKQFNSILAMSGIGLSNGYVRVDRISGIAPYYAYAVINDQATSDGSFVPPVPERDLVGAAGITLPAVVENANFNSELILTNSAGTTRTLRCSFAGGSQTVSVPVQVRPGQQLIFPNALQMLRDNGALIPVTTQGEVGALYITDDTRDVGGIFVGARTSSPGGGGRYGLFYTGIPFGHAAHEIAWLYGLEQNLENRSNVALINTGEVDSSTDSFELDIFDGELGTLAKTITGISVGPRRFRQLSMILDAYAPTVRQGYVRVRRTAGSNPFITYAVVNDGGEPGARTGDGTYIAMEVER